MSVKKQKHNLRSALAGAPFFSQQVDGKVHGNSNQTNPKGYNKAPIVRKNGQR